MMKWIVLLALVFAGFFTWKSQNAFAWREFAPEGGRFSVQFPADPAPSQKSVLYKGPFGGADQVLPFYWFETKKRFGAEMFGAGYVDLPERETNASFILNQMTGFLGNVLPNTSFSKPEADAIIDLGGVPGREIRLGTKGYILYRNKLMFARTYYDKFRLYIVVAQLRDRNAPPENAETFLASFKITK